MIAMVKQQQIDKMKEGLLLDGLKQLQFQISGQNSENISQIMETNIKSWAELEEIFNTKKEMSGTEMRPAWVTKPAKVPSWMKDLSLETYVKQIDT